MAILDSKESLILGDIAVTPSLSRSKAESALDCGFHFDNKSSEESREYHDCVRVMFLYANIYDKPGRDVLYSFEDYSLFQKYDGSFFLAAQHCEPFGGGQTLKNEFDKDFFKNTSKDEVLEIFNQSLISRISPSKDFNLLFENRKFSFYAEQRYLCFDYRVLFYHSELTPEKLKAAKSDLSVLHPLPRVNEISTEVDDDPRAAYFRQAKNGKYIRMALIMKLLEVE